jgi:Flp pilus assembly protein TadG
MQRMKDERGAVGVVVAILMVPLLGFAAIAVDAAALWTQRLQLQAGADAGALAIAHDCARGATLCGTPLSTAQQLANGNVNLSPATATVSALSSSQVTVSNSGVRDYWFAPVLGYESSTIVAQATATWGAPTGGTAVLPLTFSYCEFLAQTGGLLTGGLVPSSITQRTIYFTKSSGVAGCTGPSNNVVPGGFGWLTVNSGTCNTTSAIAGVFPSDPGNSVPSSCSTGSFAALQNKTVLLPIFDQAYSSGSNASYRVYGYAAFQITGYHFGGQYSWNAPCSGNGRCIQGYFTRYVDDAETFDFGSTAPNLGASLVKLTN